MRDGYRWMFIHLEMCMVDYHSFKHCATNLRRSKSKSHPKNQVWCSKTKLIWEKNLSFHLEGFGLVRWELGEIKIYTLKKTRMSLIHVSNKSKDKMTQLTVSCSRAILSNSDDPASGLWDDPAGEPELVEGVAPLLCLHPARDHQLCCAACNLLWRHHHLLKLALPYHNPEWNNDWVN